MSDGWSRRSVLRAGVFVGGAFAVPGAVTGCTALGLGGTLERIRREGVVRVGFANERPYSYEENGVLLGAIAALHREIFERLGEIEIRGVRTVFGDLIDGLNAGYYDVIAAGMFVTSDRCDRAAFSEPTYCAKQALLVARDNPRGLSDYGSVAGTDASLAVLGGAVEEEYARAAGVPDERIRQVGTPEDGLELVAAGEVDAFTLTTISLRALLTQVRQRPEQLPLPPGVEGSLSENVEVLDPFVPVVDGRRQRGCGAAAFRKTDEGLRAAFNGELRRLQRENQALTLMRQYGFTEAEMPEEGVTTAQLCRTGGVTGKELDPLPR